MSSPDTQGAGKIKRPPACPGGRRCKLPYCNVHNGTSKFSTDGDSLYLFGGYGMLGAYPSVRLLIDGCLYQQLDAASKRKNIGGVHDEANTIIGNTMNDAQTKIREVSGIILERMRSWFNSEMVPV